MKKKESSLNVFMNGIPVGELIKLHSGGLAFSYKEEWLGLSEARPISLSLPLTHSYYTGDRVYNFFDNLLPDNERIKSRIQALFQARSKQPFDLLASIGHDCVGAIQLCSKEHIPDIKSIRGELLKTNQIADLLRNYQQSPLGMTDPTEDFRISIAGAQEKTALLFKNGKWYKPLGATPTTHIFKLPIGMIEHQHLDLSDSCENEWLCSNILEAFGLSVAESEIIHFNDVKVLVIKRFDRQKSQDDKWIMRLPQEDMCQALGVSPALKYQSDGGPGINDIMTLLLASENATNDRENFFRSQIVFWLLAAIDGHAKNFSVFIRHGGRFCLTPFYDVMSAYPMLANKRLQKQKIKMAMALISFKNYYHWYNAQRRYFISTAKIINFFPKRAEKILDEELQKVDYVISLVSKKLTRSFPDKIAESIFTGMLQCRDRLTTEADHIISK